MRPAVGVGIHPPLPRLQGRFQGVDDPLAVALPEDQAVRHDVEARLAASLLQGMHLAALPDPVVARSAQLTLQGGGIAVRGHRKGQDDGGALGQFPEGLKDRLGRVLSHGPAAPAAAQDGHASEEQLRVVGHLRHGPHGGAGGPHGVALRDGKRRGNSLDALDAGTVHAVEELTGVGGEGLDIASLPLRVEGIEGKRRLAGSAHPRDHGQGVERDVEIEALEVMLPDPEDPDARRSHAELL